MVVRASDTNFKQEVLDAEEPVLVDFWAEWCMPCRMLGPTVDQIAKAYEGKLKVCKINVDESADTASKYEIMSIPSIMIFKGGQAVEKIVGLVPKEEIESKLKPHLEG